MRRADRLFQIIQILRRSSAPVTARDIADEVEVSTRTIYRDIADLIGQRVPVAGAAGLGYVIDGKFDLPPLMLTVDELEAAALGAQWVTGQGDVGLARAAADLLAKLDSVIPEKLRTVLAEPVVGSVAPLFSNETIVDLAKTRRWIREGKKVRIRYLDETGSKTVRTTWPVFIGHMEGIKLLAAWCELRHDFRHFRIDRILAAEFIDTPHGRNPTALRREWRQLFQRKREARDQKN